jgi:Fe-S-cluster containining protein
MARLSATARPPLISRPGARFTCHGDGLCCTDIHQLGPVTRAERRVIEEESPGTTTRLAGLVLLRIVDAPHTGGCTFLEADMRCRVHGSDTRPRTCHRFPYLVTHTPDGPRLGTDHRCPCRTLGERAPLDPEAAHEALRDRGGRLSADRRVEGRIPLRARSRVGWARYRAIEGALLEALAGASASRSIASILGVEPMPELEIGSWEQIGIDLAQEPRASRWGECFRLFGKTLAWLACPPDERPRRLLFAPRLWQASFDRAEARTVFDPPREGDVIETMYADFVADFVWGLEWTHWCSLAQLKLELATRVHVARTFARALVLAGTRPDRAAAESIAMIEVVGVSPAWMAVASRLPDRDSGSRSL